MYNKNKDSKEPKEPLLTLADVEAIERLTAVEIDTRRALDILVGTSAEKGLRERVERHDVEIVSRSDIWRPVATFLAGIVLTLLGAWATHSVSRADMDSAFAGHIKAEDGRYGVIETRLSTITENQRRTIEQIEVLQQQVNTMQAALREGPEVTITHRRKP